MAKKDEKKGQGAKKDDYPDKETKEIVEEIQSESEDKSEVADKSKEKDKEKPSDKEEEERKKREEEEEEEEEKKEKEEKESKGKSKQLKKGDKRYETGKVSFGRVKKLKKKVKTLKGEGAEKDIIIADQKEEIEKLGEKAEKMSEAELEKKIGEMAEKHKTTPEFIKDVLGLAKSQTKSPKKLEKLTEDLQREKDDVAQSKKFNTEFDDNVIPLLKKKNPDISNNDIEKVRAKLKKSAMNYPEQITLRMLYRDNPKKFYVVPVKKKSSEKKKGGESRLAKGKKWEGGKELTGDEINDLSDKEFDQYCKDMEKAHPEKSKITRPGS